VYNYHRLRINSNTTIDEQRIVAGVVGAGFNTVVHHIDGNTRNNKPENLLVMSRSDHCKLHGFGVNVRGTASFSPSDNGTAICRRCGKEKKWEDFKKSSHNKLGRDTWCKECFNEYRRTKRKEFRMAGDLKSYY